MASPKSHQNGSRGKKRGQNEGSIYQRQDGRWTAALNLGYHGGTRTRRYFYAETRDEVRKQLTTAMSEWQRGIAPAPERETLGQFLERWLVDCAVPSVRPKTAESYTHLVTKHIVPELGRERLATLAPQTVQAFLNRKHAAGLSPRTVQYLRAVLRRALNQALRWGLVARNVATLVQPPRGTRPEVRPLSPEQARALLDAVRGDRLEALYSVALAMGLRQGEALGLHWQDVDLEQGLIRVRVALQRIKDVAAAGEPAAAQDAAGGRRQSRSRLVFMEPKTQRSRRVIALPAVALDALCRHKLVQLREREWAGSRWHEHGLVFTSTIGTPLEPRNVTRQFHEHLQRADLPHQRFHDLRHTCASLLLAQGVHPRVVMETLGHSQIALTMDTYSHVLPALQREAAAQMDALLTSTA